MSAGDVQRCLAFARANDVDVAVRSGGHSYGGYSSGPGLVIDVSRLQGVSKEATNAGSKAGAGQGIVTVGAGTELIDVYSDLAAQGLLLPGGSCHRGHRRAGPGWGHRRLCPGLRADV